MNRRVRVKPGKGQSLAGFFIGIIFCMIGLFMAIPTFGPFGFLWTFIAVIITITNAYNAFSDKGVASHEIIIDDMENSLDSSARTSANLSVKDRLTELQDLYDKNLITSEEYQQKRKEILDKL
ncbi:SHOCT domain-containing protein [Anaerocolumna xylanovorans]|uniref:Short C-terminal domain-containing protein n=1 Tax=Anaerocolumna xylanovorans DSM 12503 TaxID=1121345 RepID=A0A1M7YEM2_9FIRM|nr:SHOCT domain-containing protein [Anaerocolumna xylanovorans]SHO51094.1 Short C-terminal domain-containing protein [Anaerocolumna xylanovorans DSM 12503]